MPHHARPVPVGLQTRPFRGSEAFARGWLTRRQLRSGSWQRVFTDVYVAAEVPLTHQVRTRAASLLLPQAVVTGRSAAWLWGVDVDGPDGDEGADVHLTVPPGSGRHVPGLVVRRRVLDPDHVGRAPSVRDVRVLWPRYAALDIVAEPGRSHVESVVVLDQFVQAAWVELPQLRQLGSARTGWGSSRLRAALADADGLAGSPPETRLRLALHTSALPRPQAQFLLRTPSGRRVKQLDFAWPQLRFAVEYDGSPHVGTSTRRESAFRLPKDRRVLNEAHDLGWRIYYVTAPDHHDMGGLVSRIAAALTARSAELGVPLG